MLGANCVGVMLEGAELPGIRLDGSRFEIAEPPPCPCVVPLVCGVVAPGNNRFIRVSAFSDLPLVELDAARAASPISVRLTSPRAPWKPPWVADEPRLLLRL